MNRFKTYVLGAAGLWILLLSLALIKPDAITAQNGGPAVTIGAPLPLPITGSIEVSGTPTVNANITNTPTVGFASGSTVQVGNTALSPVPMQQVAVEPVQFQTTRVIIAGSSSATDSAAFTVPAGKRLRITYASVSCALPIGQRAFGEVTTTIGSNSIRHQMSQSQPTEDPFGTSGHGQTVDIYADPNTTIALTVSRTNLTGVATCSLGVSAYLFVSPPAHKSL